MDDILDDIRDNEENDEIKDWRIFIGEQANYYIPKWEKIQSGQIISFNIYAFLFGIFWMFYRKMYRTALIVGGLLVFQFLIEDFLRINMNITEEGFKPITWSFTLLINTLFALFSNWLFYLEGQRKIEQIKDSTIDDYEVKLLQAGGTSILSVFLGMVIYIVAIAIGFLIIGSNLYQ